MTFRPSAVARRTAASTFSVVVSALRVALTLPVSMMRCVAVSNSYHLAWTKRRSASFGRTGIVLVSHFSAALKGKGLVSSLVTATSMRASLDS